jgi:hypothetical protein
MPPMAEIEVKGWKCDRCQYVWLKVTGRRPVQCPNRECRTRRWNRGTVSQSALHHPACRCALCQRK